MSPRQRRVLQALLYEAIAVAMMGPAVAWMFAASLQSSALLALAMSSIALAWNYVFNALFERWEARQTVKGRSLGRRLLHGIGFEGGLVLFLVPLMAWWLDISLLEALIADLAILAFFFVYAIVFTWAFDRVFGLPASAQVVAE
ncbi:PACE efflux transporter [Paucibacter sp. DJ1R-11]|uniref:PACE efflux transporter n=1 Tax=Paucibacter sp. DJ1R-11 TaxID=2893556 RepID=UPI0021E3E76A|nr:PACE efflux transporter [Paucibacter sp. DJ1R-11]MCV2363284.1 PACE efflux transporter [Paucibacter sp. DJ1R-11]